jgi:hypothetical protein
MTGCPLRGLLPPHWPYRPLPTANVDHLAGGGDRPLDDLFARKPVVNQVGDKQQAIRSFDQPRAGPDKRQQRVERVEVHQLDAGRLVDPIDPQQTESLLVKLPVARVAVGVRHCHDLDSLAQAEAAPRPLRISAQICAMFQCNPVGSSIGW